VNIARFSTSNPVFVNLLMAGTLIVGLVTALSLPLELFPSVEMETVTVTTYYPGASAEDVEQLVTIPIESELNDITGIKVIRSVSTEGRSVVTLELEAGEDIGDMAEKIRTEVAGVRSQLPDDAEDPLVEEVRPRFPIISVAIAGDVPRRLLREYAERLEDELRLVPGVESVTTSGKGPPVFWIRLRPERMRQVGVGLEQVTEAVAARNVDMPGGDYGQGDVEFLVRTRGRIRTADDLLSLPLKTSAGGRSVLLRDVADVELGEEKSLTRSRVNGLPAITFWINKQERADVVDTVAKVRRTVAAFRATLPEGIHIYDAFDNSHWVKERLRTMIKSGVIGLVVVLLILAAFLNLRAAAVTALGIPVAFFGAFILMDLTGVTLNLLSMFALILVLGIIVDDAIIVAENADRYVRLGYDPKTAAVKGTSEVALPVLATVLTNIAAFLPLLLTTGLIGKFLSTIPKVAIFALTVSLVEALLILPSHCADFFRSRSHRRQPRRWVNRLRSRYLRALYFVLRNRYAAVGSFVAMLALTAFVFFKMPLVLFYAHDISQFVIKVENPTWSTLEDTVESVKEIEDVLRSTIPPSALKNIVSLIGIDITGRALAFGDHLATISVEYVDFKKRKLNGKVLMREARRRTLETVVGPVNIDFVETGGPPKGKPVDVRFQGKDFATLKELAARLERYLEKIPGVYGVSDDILWGKPEARVTVDEGRAALYGLNTRLIGRAVRAMVDGLTVAKTRLGTEEADIVVTYDLPRADLYDLLAHHQIATPRGGWVPLGEVARVDLSPSLLSISRYNMERAVAVRAEVDQRVTTPTEVNAKVERFLHEVMRSHKGYSFDFAGEEQETRESVRSIYRSSIVAIVVIYTILAAILKSYFQPLIIMSVLPFALIGVAVGLLLRGDPVTFPALIGVVALLGIVVNDSLVLMDFINKRRSSMNRVMAVVVSAKHRFRPILLTTVTTFGGLASLMVHTRGEAAFLAPMAIALGFGLVFATLITLFLIPSLYLILDDIGGGLRKSTARMWGALRGRSS